MGKLNFFDLKYCCWVGSGSAFGWICLNYNTFKISDWFNCCIWSSGLNNFDWNYNTNIWLVKIKILIWYVYVEATLKNYFWSNGFKHLISSIVVGYIVAFSARVKLMKELRKMYVQVFCCQSLSLSVQVVTFYAFCCCYYSYTFVQILSTAFIEVSIYFWALDHPKLAIGSNCCFYYSLSQVSYLLVL